MNQDEKKQAQDRIMAVKRAHEAELMAKAHVVGCGVGYRRQAGQSTKTMVLVVLVDQKIPPHLLSPKDIIPAEIDGIPVDVQEVGRLTAHSN